jgi:enoyl-CoA hydratase/carnithine racemase
VSTGPHVRVDHDPPLLVVTIDRPEKRNAYDGAMLKAIAEAWKTLDREPALRVGVLTGAGEETFSTGADVQAVVGGGFADPPYPELAENLAAKPLVAAINGRCLGGGMMLATGCDLRVAAAHADFGLPEARWNLPAQWLGALARQMSEAHALELALCGDRRLSAERLYEMGWLTEIVERGEALAAACALGERIASMAPRAVRHMKALIRQSAHLDPEAALALGHEQARELMGMRDTAEGAKAFAERRPPRWKDR